MNFNQSPELVGQLVNKKVGKLELEVVVWSVTWEMDVRVLIGYLSVIPLNPQQNWASFVV